MTPEWAQELLAHNTHNRTLRKNLVDAYARDMQAGRWRYNGETIKINETQVIDDGQHRLLACVKSGCSFEVLLVTGLPVGTQETMDAGAKRTFADVLRLRGEHNYGALACCGR